MENQENNNGQLQIELKEEVAQGTYANLAIITHSSSEFILDFIRVMPGNMNVLSALSACRMSNLFRHCLTLRVKHKIKKKLVVH